VFVDHNVIIECKIKVGRLSGVSSGVSSRLPVTDGILEIFSGNLMY